MKKVMFLIVGLLLSVSVNAASLTLTGGFEIFSDSSTAQRIQGVSGDNWTSDFGVFVDVDSPINAVTVENTDSLLSLTSVNLLDESMSIVGSSVFDGAGTWTLWALLTGGVQYTLQIVGSGTGSLTATVSAVPIPAALWLFAPALIGLFGFRRKAAVAA